MARFFSPGTLEWTRKLNRCQKPKQIVKVIDKMRPPDCYKHSNCTHEAYITCLALGAVKYTELLAAIEEAQAQTI